MVSNWSELDGGRVMLCEKIAPFTEKQSLYIKNLRFVQDGNEELLLVKHLTRTGALESKIGRYHGAEKDSEWIYTSKKGALGFLTINEFIEVDLTGIFQIRDHQKTSISKKNFEILPEIISISKDRFVVVDGKEVSVWFRNAKNSFELEKKVPHVLAWQSFGPVMTFVAEEGSVRKAFLVDSLGLESTEVPSQEWFLVRTKGGAMAYGVTSGELQEKPSIRQGGEKKTWDIGYLREAPAGSEWFIQRWVEGESIVQRAAGPGFLMEDMGVLPARWWIKSILSDPQGGFRFVVEADKTWYLCQKGPL